MVPSLPGILAEKKKEKKKNSGRNWSIFRLEDSLVSL